MMSLTVQTQSPDEQLRQLKIKALQINREILRRLNLRRIDQVYPDSGPLRRER